MAERLELDEAQQLVHLRRDLGARALAHLQTEGDVVADGHVLEGRVVLEDEADVALLRPHPGRVDAVDHDRARVGLLQPGDDPEQRRLARAARPEQRGQRAALDLERDVVEGLEVAEALAHVLDDDGHGYTVSSLGRIRVRATRTSTATKASTIEIA